MFLECSDHVTALIRIITPTRHALRISAKIVEEVRQNLTREAFREFIAFLNTLSITIDEDFFVPFELGAKYESKGLKPADAFIAAYTEWVGRSLGYRKSTLLKSTH